MSIASEISRLQTAKANLKTSIEGKGVTVPSATTLDGYPALVDAISGGGGGGDFTYVVSAVISDKSLPETYSFTAENTVLTFSRNTGVETLELNVASVAVSRYNIFTGCTDLEYVKWNGVFSGTDGRDFFSNCTSLVTIDTEMDMSTFTQYGNFLYQCYYLKNFRFKPNTIKASLTIANGLASVYTAQTTELRDSLISLANALDISQTGKTLTLSNNVRPIFTSTTGTVSNDLFEYDASGSTTLSDFVVNTKGWTLS